MVQFLKVNFNFIIKTQEPVVIYLFTSNYFIHLRKKKMAKKQEEAKISMNGNGKV